MSYFCKPRRKEKKMKTVLFLCMNEILSFLTYQLLNPPPSRVRSCLLIAIYRWRSLDKQYKMKQKNKRTLNLIPFNKTLFFMAYIKKYKNNFIKL